MKDIKLVATDMDHTLLTESNELPPQLNECITELNKLGVTFAIASGRPLYTLKDVFSDYGENLTFICDNGALIFHKGKVLFESLFSFSELVSIVEFFGKKPDGIIILCGLETAYISAHNRKYKDFLHNYYSNIELTDNLGTLNCSIDKVTIYFPNKNSKEVNDKLIIPYFDERYSITVSDTIWIDIMNKGVDKGNAMRLLGDHLSISKSEMMAFGDTYNDIELLKSVKFSYIVANASKDMEQYAKYRTKSNEEFGVIEVLMKLISEKRRNKNL
ncbi:HAD family phosphatase [Listeria monocytogenes]|uniref:HAD family hydrolase n=1 Tax=Listeria monocytogenes TaxID=1639 RepID=UPI0011EACDFE|nr:HAD family hydrolase [Listeria monocytogenes]TYV61089.1 HAD family phosphatase [Listeria monocytogenes]